MDGAQTNSSQSLERTICEEKWRAIPGYDGVYEVSNRGRVRSNARKVWNYNKPGRILKPHRKENGYVSTMFGRRRPIPELKSGNFMQRSFGERVAMNSPIQGTAADIIKIAMNRVYKRLKDENLKSRLVLQVHDELLIETCKEEIPQVSAILEEEMKGAAKLSVELEVDMHQGNNWYEAK